MRKSAAIVTLAVIAISGLVVGLVIPGEAIAYNTPPIEIGPCVVVLGVDLCVYECCYTPIGIMCRRVGCP